MPAGRLCTVCKHPERAAIDRALVAGSDMAGIAKHYEVSAQSVLRHRERHIPTPAMQAGALARAEANGEHGSSLLDQVAALRDEAIGVLREAKGERDFRNALNGIRTALQALELMGKFMGKLDAGTTVNVSVEAQILPVQVAILTALLPYPEARTAVVAALEHVP